MLRLIVCMRKWLNRPTLLRAGRVDPGIRRVIIILIAPILVLLIRLNLMVA